MNDHWISTDNELDLSVVSSSSHEEADARMFLHMSSENHVGHKKILIEVNDTDVVVLGARAFALRGATQHLPSLVRAKRHPIRRGRKIACLTNRFCKCQSRQSKKQIYSDCFR